MIQKILSRYRSALGNDYHSYLNHAQRVYEYACILTLQKTSKKLALTAAFHDLDIWLSDSMNYLSGSEKLARAYIQDYRLDLLADEIGFIISQHHKLSRIKGSVEAEAFRKADLIDLTNGLIRFNLPKSIIGEIESRHPRLGFTSLILKKTIRWALSNPLNPFPMIKR